MIRIYVRRIEAIGSDEEKSIKSSLSPDALHRLNKKRNGALNLASLCALSLLNDEERADLAYTENGKPYFKNLDKSISITHSKTYAAAAISDSRTVDVGIDVEDLPPKPAGDGALDVPFLAPHQPVGDGALDVPFPAPHQPVGDGVLDVPFPAPHQPVGDGALDVPFPAPHQPVGDGALDVPLTRFFTENEKKSTQTNQKYIEIWTKKEALFKYLKNDSLTLPKLDSTTPEKYGATLNTIQIDNALLSVAAPAGENFEIIKK